MDSTWGFPMMRDIIPEGKSGNCLIEHFTISEEEARFYEMRAIFNRDYLGRNISPGNFCRLRVNGSLMTSDAGGERASVTDVCREASGNVLIAGLGLGMILCKIVPKDTVKKVTVVEISQDVINLVEQPLRKYLGPESSKLEIILHDIWGLTPEHKYDTIFFDIWGDYSGDTYEETKRLHRRFSKYLDRTTKPYMDSWMRWHMKELHFGERS